MAMFTHARSLLHCFRPRIVLDHSKSKMRRRNSSAVAAQMQDRPTHFLALQLSHSPSVLEGFKAVQSTLMAHNRALRSTLVDPASAHLTFGVVKIDPDSGLDIETVVDCMDRLQAQLRQQELLTSLQIPLKGLGTFNQQVLFFKVPDSPTTTGLHEFAAVVRSEFEAAELFHSSDKPFKPHATIAKCSKSRSIDKIPKAAFDKHLDLDLGLVEVSELQLCYMYDRPYGQYYEVEYALQLDGDC